MQFYLDEPTPRTSWRLAILMGHNARTYKFALGSALLELGASGNDWVSLQALASVYASKLVDRRPDAQQVPTATSLSDTDFLTILNRERAASIAAGRPTEALVAAAVRSIPGMVMEKFHNIRGIGQVAHTFYEVVGRDRDTAAVRLTSDLLSVASDNTLLRGELESRWSIVEASWDAGIGRSLIDGGVDLDDQLSSIVSPIRRVTVSSLRNSISGFQHGRCFYCHVDLNRACAGESADPAITSRGVHVDHVVPFTWMQTGSWRGPNLNHVWNLVLACAPCNLQKSARQPTDDELARLLARNDAIAGSPHPLRRTIEITMNASGPDAGRRRREFLQAVATEITEGH